MAFSVPSLWHSSKWLEPAPRLWAGLPACSFSASHRAATPCPRGGHCFGVCEYESPILKRSAIFNLLLALSPAKGSNREALPSAVPFPSPSEPRRGDASTRGLASPAGGEHAPPDSRSHWLLPVANPRDRRWRAPPPDPALAVSLCSAFLRGTGFSAARPAE